MLKEIGKVGIGFGLGLMLLLGLYFFVYRPDIKKAHDEGLRECQQDTDTLFLPGKDKIVYRDKIISKPSAPIQVKLNDSLAVVSTIFDSSWVSGKDSLHANAQATIKIKRENGGWKFDDAVADWLMNIEHKDFTQIPDTIKITYPIYKEVVVEKTNWLITFISFVGALILGLLL